MLVVFKSLEYTGKGSIYRYVASWYNSIQFNTTQYISIQLNSIQTLYLKMVTQ